MNDVDAQDFDGTELPNLAAAKAEAQKDIDEIKRTEFESVGNNWSQSWIEICDHNGALLLVVPFSSS